MVSTNIAAKPLSELPLDVCLYRQQPSEISSEVVPVWRSKAHLSNEQYDNWSKLDTRLRDFFKCTLFCDKKNSASKNCFATFAIDRDFLRHLKDKHYNDTLYCVYCYPKIDRYKDYKNMDEVKPYNHEMLVKHMKQCHGFRKYQCNMCLYRAVSVDHVNVHQSKYHTNNYGLKSSNGRRECKILECQPIDVNPMRITAYFKKYGVKRVVLPEFYQCAFCEFPHKELIQVIDHCADNHPDYPLLFYSPKRVRMTTEITVARDDGSDEECRVVEDDDHRHSSSSAKKMQENRLLSTSHRERLLNASKERLKVYDKQKANRERVMNRFKYVGCGDRDGTRNKNSLQNIRMNASKGNTLQKLHQRIKDKKVNSVNKRNIRHNNRNKLEERLAVHRVKNKLVEKRNGNRLVNRGKFMTRYSEGSSDEDEGLRKAKSSEESNSESEDAEIVKLSDDSNDSVVPIRHSSPTPATDKFVCAFCNHITGLKIRIKSHMESHFNELCAIDPNYKRSKRVDRWIRLFAEKQHDLAAYADSNTPGYENQYHYQCPICVKLAQTKRKQAKSFRYFLEVRNHFLKHIAWSPVSCRVCDPPEELPNCDTIINKHLNSVHQNMLINSDSSVISTLLGDKMRNPYTYRQRKAVENHFIDVHHDSVLDEFIKKQLYGIHLAHEKNLRILNDFPEELPSVLVPRLPDIDYENENTVKKYLEAVKMCETRVKTLIQENRMQRQSSEDSGGSSSSEESRVTKPSVRKFDEMVTFMNSLTAERPVGCGRCKRAFRDLLDHNKQHHTGMAMMPIRKLYNA